MTRQSSSMGTTAAYAPLRLLISEHYGVSDDQVLVGNGSLHLMDMIAAILIKPGDVVLIEQPSYDSPSKRSAAGVPR